MTPPPAPSPGPAPDLPPLAPLLDTIALDVGDGQRLHVEVSGAPDGVPALYLHGGPGGRLRSGYRRSVPADRCRLVGLGQRGAGDSTPSAADPAADLSVNTTAHLVADIERVREHLGIQEWVVQGVSWGSTLALAYAQAHPERVRAIVLMAVTSTSRREVDWITEGIGAVFPEGWDALATFAETHGDFDRQDRSEGRVRLVEAYRRMLTSGDPRLAEAAADAWMTWEDEHIRLGTGGTVPVTSIGPAPSEEERAHRLAFARLVTHYWAHDGFVADWAVPWGAAPGSGLLGGMHQIAQIPAVLIHGRCDVSGPVLTAWELHRAWPASELVIVEDEGHGGPVMAAHWRAAMERFTWAEVMAGER